MTRRCHVRSALRVPRPAGAARRSALVAAVALLAPLATEAGAQELRYSLTPVAQRVQWDDDLALDNTWLYGGRVGFLFGNWVELQGFYLRGTNVDTRFGAVGLPAPGGGALPEGQVDIDNFGADVIVNLGSARIRPFLKAGGSVLRFEPDGAERTNQIALRAGGGVRFGDPGQIRVQLFVEDLAFRLNRYRLTTGDDDVLPSDPDGDDVRHNLVYGAGVSIPLGGAVGTDDAPRFGVAGLSLPIELFAGVLNFDDDDDLDGQNLAGVRTGIDFGPFVGLRGYYWRGVNDDFDATTPLQSWGGEAQFNLNAGPGIAPFLVAGAGQLDFRSGFRNDAGDALEDRTVLILGGGVSLRLSDRLHLQAAARNYLSGPSENVADVSRTDDLRGNWLFSAGLGFNLGGSTANPPPARPVIVRVPDTTRMADTARMADTTRRADTVYVDARTGERVRAPERTRIQPAMPAAGDTMRMRDTVYVDRLTGERISGERIAGERVRAGEVEPAARAGAPREGYISDRATTIPVPTEGEIYIRYGPGRDAQPPMQGRGVEAQRMGPPMERQMGPPMVPMIDPRTGMPIDPRTGMLMDPRTGMLMDPRTGMLMDPRTGVPMDPRLGMPMDPRLGGALAPGLAPVQPYPLSPAELREAVREVIRDELERERMGAMLQPMAPEVAPGARLAPPRQGVVPRTVPAPQRRVPTTKAPTDTAGFEARVMARVDQLMAMQMQAYRDSLRMAGLARGAVPGAMPGAVPGAMPGAVPGAMPDTAMMRSFEERERERERRMLQEMERIVSEQVRREMEQRMPAREVAPPTPAPVVQPQPQPQPYGFFRPQAWSTYGGATISDDAQFVLGARMDLGSFLTWLPALDLVPEVALGFGSGATTALVAANAQFSFGRLGLGGAGSLRPYLGLGLGLMTFSDELAGRDGLDVVLNPAIGSTWAPSSGATFAGARLFFEYQGVAGFDIDRLNAGLRWGDRAP